MLRDAEKKQQERLTQRVSVPLSEKFTAQATNTQQALPNEEATSAHQSIIAKRVNQSEYERKLIPLTHDEAEWLSSVAGRQGHSSSSGVLFRLIDWANSE